MLHFFEAHAALFNTWRVTRYEREGEAYWLHVSGILKDGSRLEVSDYVFADGSRTYAFQWMEADGSLRQRWDNAPHWPDIATFPHHTHLPGQPPAASRVTNIEDMLNCIEDWFANQGTP